MKKGIIFISCIMLLVFGSNGCGKKAKEKVAAGLVGNIMEKAIGQNASVDINNGNINIKTADGTMDISEGNLKIKSKDGDVNMVSGEEAENVAFPNDVFKYPNATVKLATTAATGSHFALETSDDAKKVYSTYKAEMEKLGWETKMAAQEDDGGMLMFGKGSNITQVFIGKEDDKVGISIIKGENK